MPNFRLTRDAPRPRPRPPPRRRRRRRTTSSQAATTSAAALCLLTTYHVAASAFFLACCYNSCFCRLAAASSPAVVADPLESSRYQTLPPTVFAPSGRLHMVDRVGRASSDARDGTAPLVVAIRCGGGAGVGKDEGEDWGEFVVVVGTAPRSPHGHYGLGTAADAEGLEAGAEEQDSDGGEGSSQFRSPLLLDDFDSGNGDKMSGDGGNDGEDRPCQSLPATMSILSPQLLVATGGRPPDAAVLLRRLQDVASSLHEGHHGGTGFMYHGGGSNGNNGGGGGMSGAAGPDLARRMADTVQVPTQTVGGRGGRMLAASALIVDSSPSSSSSSSSSRFGGRRRRWGSAGTVPSSGRGGGRNLGRGGTTTKTSVIWRVDPTGQFWSCDAAAVGRGAGVAEASLLRRAAEWKVRGDDDDAAAPDLGFAAAAATVDDDEQNLDDVVAALSNEDVAAYLGTLTVEEAVAVACRCVSDAIGGAGGGRERTKGAGLDKDSGGDDVDMSRFAGVGGAVLRPSRGLVEVLPRGKLREEILASS